MEHLHALIDGSINIVAVLPIYEVLAVHDVEVDLESTFLPGPILCILPKSPKGPKVPRLRADHASALLVLPAPSKNRMPTLKLGPFLKGSARLFQCSRCEDSRTQHSEVYPLLTGICCAQPYGAYHHSQPPLKFSLSSDPENPNPWGKNKARTSSLAYWPMPCA